MRVLLFFSFIAVVTIDIRAQWNRVNGIPEMAGVPSLYSDGNTIYAGTDSVIYLSRDNAQTWQPSAKLHAEVDFISALILYSGRIIAGSYNFGVFESADEGITWSDISAGLTGAGAKTISSLVIRNSRVYAGTYGAGVFVKDLNSAAPWTAFNNGLPPSISFNVNNIILIDSILYAGAGGNGYYYTNSPGSDVWIEKQFGMLSGEPLSMFDIIYTQGGGYLISSYGIYKSTDSGESWQPYNLSNGLISKGGFVKAGNELYLYLSKASRTIWYRSVNSGTSWESFGQVQGANTLSALYTEGKLLDGRLYGLWYYPLNASFSPDETTDIKEFSLSPNYPNPFNSSTQISFYLPRREHVQMKVYSATGEEAANLLNETKDSGEHHVRFNADNFTSGIYFYRLYSGENVQTGKMILLK